MSETDDKPRSRQEIYDEIRQSSKDEYILSEMIRLGFWQQGEEKPSLTEALIKKRGKLSAELRELGKQLALYENPEAALKAMHKERKKIALENREKKRQERNLQRFNKAERWHQKQLEDITYLGDDISIGLSNKGSDVERLSKLAMPKITTVSQLAEEMGISVNELRFISYKRKVSHCSHYVHFAIPKKTGGIREIAAPKPRIKRSQYWILDNILSNARVDVAAHGFMSQRSIMTNAANHVRKELVINLDLKDFFPSVSFRRVKGLFRSFGYSEQLAIVLASICTEPDVALVELDGESFYVAQSEPRLAQGAPTSPMLSNILCRKLDRRMQGIANSLGYDYSRYADDLTFSANNKQDSDIKKLFWRINAVIKEEGFTLHKEKTRIMRKHRKQEVTGIVVNDGLSVDRKTLRRFRALLFQIDKDGPQDKHWGNAELFSSIDGYANFVAMVKPEKGILLQKKVVDLKRKYQQPVRVGKIAQLNKKLFRLKAAAGEQPREDWWSAKAPEPPLLEKTPLQISTLKKQRRDELKRQQEQSPRPTSRERQRKKSSKVSFADVFWVLMGIMFVILWWSRN